MTKTCVGIAMSEGKACILARQEVVCIGAYLLLWLKRLRDKRPVGFLGLHEKS